MKPTPVMPWDSNDPFDPDGVIVWWSRLDNRYQVEVRRVDERAAILRIFDHTRSDHLIHEESVGLSYGAIFGPDVADVAEWQERAMRVVDSATE